LKIKAEERKKKKGKGGEGKEIKKSSLKKKG